LTVVADLRELRRGELPLLATIDRSERIDAEYALVDGALELRNHVVDVSGWHTEEISTYVARLVALFDAGGVVLGAWDGDALIGLGSLDVHGVGGDPTVAKLDMLYTSRPHRGRRVGSSLTAALAKRARSQGATALYISATPTRGTVDAYLAMGAALAPEPDPELLALEPEDIHLVLPI
jgi:GNAT superfamily N-acetyltransferase